MLAREVMTSPVLTVTFGTPVHVAAALLLAAGVTALPVLDHAGRLVGIVSKLDLIKREVEADPRAHHVPLAHDEPPLPRHVEDVMTAAVIAVRDSADVADVVAVMADKHLASVPVTSGAKVVGIISRGDVLRMLLRGDEVIRRDVSRRITEAAGVGDLIVAVDHGVVSIGASGDPHRDLLAELAARTVPGVRRVNEPAAAP